MKNGRVAGDKTINRIFSTTKMNSHCHHLFLGLQHTDISEGVEVASQGAPTYLPTFHLSNSVLVWSISAASCTAAPDTDRCRYHEEGISSISTFWEGNPEAYTGNGFAVCSLRRSEKCLGYILHCIGIYYQDSSEEDLTGKEKPLSILP